ncbi:DUF922 domain-containing protein [Candidatus Saccharibacteria bacterium]|nr:MAG: DUF922 domain-containing protein [Candidatus Saccharibacteria bacterium]
MILSFRRRLATVAGFMRLFNRHSQLFILCLLIFCIHTDILRISSHSPVLQLAAIAKAQVVPLPSTVSSTDSGSTAATAEPTAAAQTSPALSQTTIVLSQKTIATSQVCTGYAYALPAAVALGSAAPGLSQQIDAPTYYTVYGSSVSSLRKAVTNCPLRKAAGAYHAATAYQLNWAYTPTVTNGFCSITDVKVGLHVNQLMPAFSPGNAISPEVASAWDSYAHALKTHEDGHAAIDTNYATRLTVALQNLGSIDCNAMTSQVQTVIDSYVAMLDTANELYDAQTNHGATQGAIL